MANVLKYLGNLILRGARKEAESELLRRLGLQEVDPEGCYALKLSTDDQAAIEQAMSLGKKIAEHMPKLKLIILGSNVTLQKLDPGGVYSLQGSVVAKPPELKAFLRMWQQLHHEGKVGLIIDVPAGLELTEEKDIGMGSR